MNTLEDEISSLGQTILKLERFIHEDRVTDSIFEKVQAQIDRLDEKYSSVHGDKSNKLLTRLYELQALIYYGKGDEKKAAEFINNLHELVPHPHFLSDTIIDLASDGKMPEVREKSETKTKDGASKQLFIVSSWRLFFLSLITIGIYDRYWQYKSWKAIEAITGKKQAAGFNALFAPFCIGALSRELGKVIDSEEKKVNMHPWLRLFIYWLLCIFTAGFLASFAVIWLQQQVTSNSETKRKKGFSGGEVVLVILGLAYAAAVVAGLFYSEDSSTGGFTYTRDNYVASCVSVANGENSSLDQGKVNSYCGCIYDTGVQRFGVADFTKKDSESTDANNLSPEMNQLVNDCMYTLR